MPTIPMRVVLAATPLLTALLVAQQQPEGPKINLGPDANGNPLRLAVKTGHVSNYDAWARAAEWPGGDKQRPCYHPPA